MNKTLGAVGFYRDPIKWDYCWKESIQSMKDFADQVVIIDANSTDGSWEEAQQFIDDKCKIIRLPEEMWTMMKGRTKLAKMQNIAIYLLDTDYSFLCQMDEVVSENCYDNIRRAMEVGSESYMCTRYNYWGSTNKTMLNVSQERKPCSTEVIRLAKTEYLTFNDGEMIACPHVNFDFKDQIRIHHVGYIRKKEIHPYKIQNMLVNIFQMGETDKKAPVGQDFQPDLFFSDEDLIPIPEPHPKIMENWIKDRP
jgi:hypothetical protein